MNLLLQCILTAQPQACTLFKWAMVCRITVMPMSDPEHVVPTRMDEPSNLCIWAAIVLCWSSVHKLRKKEQVDFKSILLGTAKLRCKSDDVGNLKVRFLYLVLTKEMLDCSLNISIEWMFHNCGFLYFLAARSRSDFNLDGPSKLLMPTSNFSHVSTCRKPAAMYPCRSSRRMASSLALWETNGRSSLFPPLHK